jgi:hypothetical protein
MTKYPLTILVAAGLLLVSCEAMLRKETAASYSPAMPADTTLAADTTLPTRYWDSAQVEAYWRQLGY